MRRVLTSARRKGIRVCSQQHKPSRLFHSPLAIEHSKTCISLGRCPTISSSSRQQLQTVLVQLFLLLPASSLGMGGLAGLWCMICPARRAHTAPCAGHQGHGSCCPILQHRRLALMPVSSSAVPTAAPEKPCRRALQH